MICHVAGFNEGAGCCRVEGHGVDYEASEKTRERSAFECYC